MAQGIPPELQAQADRLAQVNQYNILDSSGLGALAGKALTPGPVQMYPEKHPGTEPFPLHSDGMICTPVEQAIFECMHKIHEGLKQELRSDQMIYKLEEEIREQQLYASRASEAKEVYQKMLESLFKQVDDIDSLKKRLLTITQEDEQARNIIDAAIFGSMGD